MGRWRWFMGGIFFVMAAGFQSARVAWWGSENQARWRGDLELSSRISLLLAERPCTVFFHLAIEAAGLNILSVWLPQGAVRWRNY